MCPRPLRWFILTLAAVAPLSAQAQEKVPNDLQAARALFDAARVDEGARRWGEALLKFQRVLESRETASLRYHLAYCEEKIGLIATARRDYARALELAKATPGPDRKLIVEGGEEALKTLEPRVPKLEVLVGSGITPTKVLLDDRPFTIAPNSEPSPVDPGHHTLEIVAPGKKPFRQDFVLKEYETRVVRVAFEPEKPAPPANGAPTESVGTPLATPTRPSAALTWALVGTSVALGGMASGFFATGRSQQNHLDQCRDKPDVYLCKEHDIAATRTRNFIIAGVSGAVSVGLAGSALWRVLSGGKAPPPKQGPQVGLVVTPKHVGLKVSF